MKRAKESRTFFLVYVRTLVCFCFIVFLMVQAVPTAFSLERGFVRQGGLEFFILGQQLSGDTTRASNFPLDIEVEDAFVLGAGLGMNLNDYINLNFDTWFGRTDINARGPGFFSKTKSDLVGIDVNLDYHLLRSQVTPVLTGGIGFVRFTGSVAGLDFDEADFSYNLGGGIRWDISTNLFFKGLYRFTWTELEDTQDRILLDGLSFSIGYVFR